MNNWIKSEDLLPEPGVDVLVYHGGTMDVRHIVMVKWENARDQGIEHKPAWYPGGSTVQRSSWQPLPPDPET